MPESNLKIVKNAGINVAIFASGAGSNAKKIIEHFRNSSLIKISLVVCNKPQAGVINIAGENKIPVVIITRNKFFNEDGYLDELKSHDIKFIVLAGFLWKIPTIMIDSFPLSIINIHPALLPKYGGKNMYGNYVHEAVIAAGEKQSGITIHYVDEKYDNGDIIFQERCSIDEYETAITLAAKIHTLEHKHYPAVIENVIQKQIVKKILK